MKSINRLSLETNNPMESCNGNGGDPLIIAAVGGSLCLMAFGAYAICLMPILLGVINEESLCTSLLCN